MKTIELKEKTSLTISKKGNNEIKFQYEESDLIYEGTCGLEDISGFEDQNDVIKSINKNMISIKEGDNNDKILNFKNEKNFVNITLSIKTTNNYDKPECNTKNQNISTSPGNLLDDEELQEYKKQFLDLENENKKLRKKNEELKKKIEEAKRKNDEEVKVYLKNMEEYSQAVKRNAEITRLVNEI